MTCTLIGFRRMINHYLYYLSVMSPWVSNFLTIFSHQTEKTFCTWHIHYQFNIYMQIKFSWISNMIVPKNCQLNYFSCYFSETIQFNLRISTLLWFLILLDNLFQKYITQLLKSPIGLIGF